MDIQTAIEAPRWAHDIADAVAPQNELFVEARFGEKVLAELVRRGHKVRVMDAYDPRAGNAQGIVIEQGVYMGGADPRGDGVAIGW